MADKKNITDKRDRNKVAKNEPYELSYLEEKLNVNRSEVEEAILRVGNDRKKVEEFLSQKSNK